jgi:hypothetical protein
LVASVEQTRAGLEKLKACLDAHPIKGGA